MIERITKFNVFWWLLLAFVAIIPLSQSWSMRLLIVILVVALFQGSWENSMPRLIAQAWDLLLYLLVLGVGLLYSADLEAGWKEIETTLSFVAVPFIFMRIRNFDNRRFNTLLYAFVGGIVLTCLVYLLHASWLYTKDHDSRIFFSGQLTGVIDNSHPTYLAYYIIFSITIGLNLLYYEELKISRVIVVSTLFFLFVMLLLTAGKTAFISMLLILAFFILKFLFEPGRTTNKKWAFGAVCFFLVIMFAVDSAEDWKPAGYFQSDSWERSTLWESAIRATPDILWGAGTGDYKNVMNEYYKTHKLTDLAYAGYNSHNQFIQLLLSNGLLGVIALLLILGRPLYLSVRNQSALGTLIFFPFFIYGMTEVFLGRYQGVIFFALLHQTFVAHYQRHKPSFSLKDV